MATVALCAACVLTKQHYVLDVVAGLGVGGLAVTVVDVARSGFGYRPRWTAAAIPAAGPEIAE